MNKVKNGIAPAYLSELVEHYKPGRMLRSSSLDKFVELPSLVIGGDRAFSKASPVFWNKLLLHIRNTKSLISFKCSLKTHLFQLEYNIVWFRLYNINSGVMYMCNLFWQM